MKLALLGYGRFGRALAELARGRDIEVSAWDAAGGGDVPSAADALRGASHVVVAVPVARTADVLAVAAPHLSASQLVMDVGSVKVHPVEALDAALGDRVPWVGTHPLFGPASLALAERPMRVVVCPNTRHPDAAPRARAFYEGLGCEVFEATAEEHDRLMARTHALAFFVAKGVLDAHVSLGQSAPPPFTPASYQGLARTVETVRSDAGHLFRAIEQENPYASEARRALIDALLRADRALADVTPARASAPPAGSGAPAGEVLSIPDLGDLSPTLRATRAHIDALDRELLALVARRCELSRRAGGAKRALGYDGVVDAAREAEVIAARREWSKSAGLDPDAVAEVFEAVVRLSRAVQKGD
jgi:prephenate dehydrogenase